MARDDAPTRRLHPAHALLLLPLATALLLGWHSLADRDVWFHERAGADLLREGRLLHTNHYSFTAPDHPWVNHEWLFEAVIAASAPDLPPSGSATVAGWNVLRTLLVLALAAVLVLGDGTLARGVPPGRPALAAAALLGALGMLWTRLTLRPELVSYLLLAVLVRAVQRALADPAALGWRSWYDPRRAPGLAVLTTLLWAQCHGFATLAPLVWLLGIAGALADGRGKRGGAILRRGLAGAGLALVALAVTPNGPAGLLLPLRALGQFRGDRPDLGGVISELVPLLHTRDALATTLLVFKLSLAWSALWIVLQRGRVPVLRVLLLAASAAAALAAQRALGLYAVAFVLLHTGTAWPLRPVARRALPPARLRALGPAAVGLGLIAVCALWWPRIVSDRFYLEEGVARRFGGGLTPAHTPTATLGELVAARVPTVLANVDAAGAVLAARGPAVFIDGRTEAYPPDLWRDYGRLREGGAPARAVLARWRPAAVLLAYGSGAFVPLAKQLLGDPAWTLLGIDGTAALFLPAGTAPEADAGATIAALVAAAGRPGVRSARAADLCLAAARTAVLVGDQEAAVAALQRGAALRPDHPQVQHNLGNALMAEGRLAQALDAFTAAIAANGRQAGSALNAGACALRLGRVDDAARWFARAAAIDPGRFEAWIDLAAARRRQGDRDGERRALEKALALHPDDARLRELLRGL